MPNTGKPHSAGKPAGRIKGDVPTSEGNQLDADAIGGRAGEPEDEDLSKRDEGVGIANENNIGTE